MAQYFRNYTQSPELLSPDVERQRRTADMLRQQSFQQPQGQMVSGRYVAPSFTQGLNQLFSGYASGQLDKMAGETQQRQQSELSQALRTPTPPPEGIRAPGYKPPELTERLSSLENNPQAQQLAMQLRLREATREEQPRLQTMSGESYGFPKGTTVQVNTMTGQVTPLYQPEAPDYNQAVIIGPDGQPQVNPAYVQAQSQIRAAGRNETNVNVSTGADKFAEEAAKTDAQRFSEASQAGQQAARNSVRIERLAELLSQTPGGLGSQAKFIAGNFGIQTEGLGDVQAAAALINSLVPEQRPPGSGPMSDADLELFKQSLPRLINTPGGNEQIMQTMRAINQYDQEIARISNMALSGEISRNEARDMMMQVENPLQGFSAPQQNESTTGLTEAEQEELRRLREELSGG